MYTISTDGINWTDVKLSEEELFRLDASEPIIVNLMDAETPLSIFGNTVRADWYKAGEGYCGDYDPDDPNDTELLRFDIYHRADPECNWEAVEDASYCTLVPAKSELKKKIKLLAIIYKRYADVLESDPECSVKKLGEELSWIS